MHNSRHGSKCLKFHHWEIETGISQELTSQWKWRVSFCFSEKTLPQGNWVGSQFRKRLKLPFWPWTVRRAGTLMYKHHIQIIYSQTNSEKKMHELDFLFLITCVWVCTHECSANRGQRQHYRLWGTELRSSIRAVCALNHWAISAASDFDFWDIFT